MMMMMMMMMMMKIIVHKIALQYSETNSRRFPKEILWLNGAPGAGKGTVSEVLKKERQIQHLPISSILNSERALELKRNAMLVNDEEVVFMLLDALLKPEYTFGVIIDGVLFVPYLWLQAAS